MERNYQITIHDIHTVDGDTSDTTMTVFGTMEKTDTGYVLRYLEQSGELTGFVTELTVTEPDSVFISRQGDYRIELMLETARRHECHYDTPHGSLMMGVYTNGIDSRMSTFGGTLHLNYDIDFNAGFVSENQLHITVKEIF